MEKKSLVSRCLSTCRKSLGIRFGRGKRSTIFKSMIGWLERRAWRVNGWFVG